MRSEYGMTNLIPIIGDEVEITIDVEFNHPSMPPRLRPSVKPRKLIEVSRKPVEYLEETL